MFSARITFLGLLLQLVHSYENTKSIQNYEILKFGPCTAQLDDGRVIDLC